MSLPQYAIIVAGGKGTRMGKEIPKQFLLLKNRPLLMHTLEAFYRYSPEVKLILGLPENDIPTWKELCKQYHFTVDHTIIKGGKTRFQTVKNCLAAIEGAGTVAVHDGVRPLIKTDVIAASYHLANLHKTAVASVRLKESLRKINQDGTESVDRSQYRLIQTPQTFQLELLKKAYETEEEPWMTDDASVVQYCGYAISLFEGHYENIKITTPSDLPIAEALMSVREDR